MPRITLDLTGFEEDLDEEVGDILFDIGSELVNQLQIEAPTGASGDLQTSFQIFRRTNRSVYLGSRLPYALFVQTGTRPHTPPFAPFQVWARRVLGDEDAAGAVWQKIREEGTDANPYMTRAFENTLDRFS